MKKRSILITALALVLVAALSIGGTMAYFTATSGPKNNVFTVGNISIALNEPGWNAPGGSDIATNMTPGAEAKKNPTVSNTSTTNPCYVRLAITGLTNNAGTLAAPNGFTIKDLDAANWTIVTISGKVYAYYNKILKSGETTTELFKGIAMNTGVKEGTLNGFTIVLNAEAIQCQGDLAPTAGETELAAAQRAFNNFPTT